MQKQSLVFSGAAMRRLAVLIAAGGIALVSTVAQADDAAKMAQQQDSQAAATPAATTTQTDVPKTAAKDSKQDSGKQLAAATADKSKDDRTPKFDLATPSSKLNFYGTAEAGFATASFKPACGNKTVHASESYYQMTVGTDIKLAGDVTLGIEVGSARGVTRFH